MKKFYTLCLIMAISMSVYAQNKVAFYVTGTLTNTKKVLESTLKRNFTKRGTYVVVERTESNLLPLIKELKYQSSGMVRTQQLSSLGNQLGVDYVCIVDVSDIGGSKFISSQLVDVESAVVVKVASTTCKSETVDAIVNAGDIIGYQLCGEKVADNKEVVRMNYVEQVKGVNISMVWVEGGVGTIGCTYEQSNFCEDLEKPSHSIKFDGYYIGQFEITQSQWYKIMGTTVEQQKNKADDGWVVFGVGDDYPMCCVSWDEAMEFCKKLSGLTGRTYTLPTEEQWEYAARGGQKSNNYRYSGGDNINDVAWYYNNSGKNLITPDTDLLKSAKSAIRNNCGFHKVGSKLPNELGLYDMSGNALEWCDTWYNGNYSGDWGANVIPEKHFYRMTRGGSYMLPKTDCRLSKRSASNPNMRAITLGFRIVCFP